MENWSIASIFSMPLHNMAMKMCLLFDEIVKLGHPCYNWTYRIHSCNTNKNEIHTNSSCIQRETPPNDVSHLCPKYLWVFFSDWNHLNCKTIPGILLSVLTLMCEQYFYWTCWGLKRHGVHIFHCIFFTEKFCILFKISLTIVPNVPERD